MNDTSFNAYVLIFSLVVLLCQKILRKGFPQLSKLKTLIIQDKGKQDTSLLAATTTYVVSACPRLQKLSLVYF